MCIRDRPGAAAEQGSAGESAAGQSDGTQEKNPSGTEDAGTAPSDEGEDSGSMTEEAWQEQLGSLRQSVETAKRALEDARQSRDSALAEAERAVEDAGSGSTADNSLEINRLELASQQKQLKEYQELLNADGMVYPEKEGIITLIAVSPVSYTHLDVYKRQVQGEVFRASLVRLTEMV